MADWKKIISRGDVQDRRGFAPAVGGISLTGLALVLLLNYATGGDINDVLQQLESVPTQNQQVVDTTEFAGEDSYEVFASTVLGSLNDTWTTIFNENNTTYTPPTLVLFRTATESGCGTATSQVGPHYCPEDKTIYLDETFFDELKNRLGAQGGDVAEAYVIAHEVGHHVQNEFGVFDRMYKMSPEGKQQHDINIELQADCYAGVWASSIRDLNVMEPNEIQEAMDAAAAVGDDRIQEKVSGQVNPETWTHGSSEQRVAAFNTGYGQGNFEGCQQML